MNDLTLQIRVNQDNLLGEERASRESLKGQLMTVSKAVKLQ
jgi:hypothetical protein